MKKTICLLTAVLMAGTLVNASLLAAWENDHLTGPEVSTIAGEAPSAGSKDANILTAVLGRGPGATTTNYTDTFAMRNANSTSLADAVTGNRFWDIELEAATGYQMDLDNFFVRLTAQNASGVGNASYFTLRSSLTGITDLATYTVGGTGVTGSELGQIFNTDLSGITELQGITAVNFSLYAWSQNAKGDYDQVGIGRSFQTNATTDLSIEGTLSVIPEPGVFALALLGFVMLLRFRRK